MQLEVVLEVVQTWVIAGREGESAALRRWPRRRRDRGEKRALELLGEADSLGELLVTLGLVMVSKSKFIVEKTAELLKSTAVLRPDMFSGLCAGLTRGNCFVGSLARGREFSQERRFPRMGLGCPRAAACAKRVFTKA